MSVASAHVNNASIFTNQGNKHRQSQSTRQSAMPISAGDREELDQLDAAFQRIATAIPEYPYLLSIPVTVEPRFHYRSAQESESWARGTPFTLHEEGLQYMTYVYREPGDSCFVVKSHLDEERERLAAQTKREQIAGKFNGSALGAGIAGKRPGTPVGAKGKKISLEAYKSKLAAGGNTITRDKTPEKGNTPPVKMESKELSKSNGVHASRHSMEGSSHKLPPTPSLKRLRDAEGKDVPDIKSKAVKKPRLSPPSSIKTSPKTPPADHPNGRPHGLPALLSPTNPFEDTIQKPVTPRKRPVSKPRWELPEMLSPTLPPRIEAELKMEKQERDSYGQANEKATPTPGTSAPNSAQKQKPRDRKNGARADAVVSENTITQERVTKGSDDLSAKAESPVQPAKKRLTVRLKFNKRHSRVLSKMLRYPPDKDRAYSLVEKAKTLCAREDEREAGVAEKERKKKPAAEKVTQQYERPHPDVTEPPNGGMKKSKLLAPIEVEKNPKTPISSAVPSPSIQKSGGSIKSFVNTPGVNQLKSVAMARSLSGDTPASTPGGKAAQSYLTPSAALTSQKSGKGPTSVPSNSTISPERQAEVTALSTLFRHYNQLGRSLKHENVALNTSKSKDQQSEPERKRAALLGLECIISYMLAFALGDARRRLAGRASDVESTWKTLLPLFKQLRSDMTRYNALNGLYSSLGVAINARIVAATSDRLSRTIAASPGNASMAADSPQSAVETNAEGGMTRLLIEAARTMMDCSRDAAIHFPVEEIQRVFKQTWAQRAAPSPRDAVPESLVNDKGEAALSGRYCIPIAVDASPVYAVRYGVSLIKEFIAIEELGYEPRIRL